MSRRTEFRVLGQLEVIQGDRQLALGGPKDRVLLALFIIHANEVVSVDCLAETLWGKDPPTDPTATLHVYISNLRKRLEPDRGRSGGPGMLLTNRPGYVLRLEPSQVDALCFADLVADGRRANVAGDPADAVESLQRALALWRGRALADLADHPFARSYIEGLEEARVSAREDLLESKLVLGRHTEVVGELQSLVAEHPLRERLRGQLMLALYRSGRQAEALAAYRSGRSLLVEGLGVDPTPALQRLEMAILRHDAELDPPTLTGPVDRRSHPPAVQPPRPHGGRPEPARQDDAGSGGLNSRVAPPSHNLPLHLTRFIGRGRELQEIRQLLTDSRLVTLAGGGGSGKTRLAIELISGHASQWRDGVHFVDLSALDKPELLAGAVAVSIGLSERCTDFGSVYEHLGSAQILLVLDNCEALVDACAEFVEAVLSRCSDTTVLATSQEELRIEAERVWRVPPLSLPDSELPERTGLLASEAVQLFLDRASSLRDFLEDPSVLDSVAEICHRLDGIPLAIELAASLVDVLPLEEIVRRLDDRLALLTRGSRRSVARHRTLRAAIDWSYELLEESERTLFDRLSVFVGQFSVEAAEAAASDAGSFLTDLSALVSKSMVGSVPGPGGSRRYQLLDSLRLYGLERLAASGHEADARRRHAAYYMSFAVATDRRHHGSDPAVSADSATRMLKELPNVRAALEWSFSDGDVEVGVLLAGAMRCGYFVRMGAMVTDPRRASTKLLDQAREWIEAALAPGRGLSPPLRLKALTAAMALRFSLGEYRWTSTVGDEAIALAEEIGDDGDRAFTFMAVGGASVYEGRVSRAVECFERSLAYCRAIGDWPTRSSVLTYWGAVSRRLGDDDLSKRQLEDALAIFRALHDDYNQVVPLIQLALLELHLGNADRAWRISDEALVLARRLGDRHLSHGALCVAGLVELARGRQDEADTLLRASLTIGRGVEHFLMVAMAVEGFAVVAHHEGRDTDAARLWGFADAVRSTQGIPLFQERLAERERLLADARARPGGEAIDQAMAVGRGMSYAQVLDELKC